MKFDIECQGVNIQRLAALPQNTIQPGRHCTLPFMQAIAEYSLLVVICCVYNLDLLYSIAEYRVQNSFEVHMHLPVSAVHTSSSGHRENYSVMA